MKSAKKSYACLTRISRAISRASYANPTHIQTHIQRASTNRVRSRRIFLLGGYSCHCVHLTGGVMRESAPCLVYVYRTKSYTNPCHKNAALRPYHYSYAHNARYRLLWPRPRSSHCHWLPPRSAQPRCLRQSRKCSGSSMAEQRKEELRNSATM